MNKLRENQLCQLYTDRRVCFNYHFTTFSSLSKHFTMLSFTHFILLLSLLIDRSFYSNSLIAYTTFHRDFESSNLNLPRDFHPFPSGPIVVNDKQQVVSR